MKILFINTGIDRWPGSKKNDCDTIIAMNTFNDIEKSGVRSFDSTISTSKPWSRNECEWGCNFRNKRYDDYLNGLYQYINSLNIDIIAATELCEFGIKQFGNYNTFLLQEYTFPPHRYPDVKLADPSKKYKAIISKNANIHYDKKYYNGSISEVMDTDPIDPIQTNHSFLVNPNFTKRLKWTMGSIKETKLYEIVSGQKTYTIMDKMIMQNAPYYYGNIQICVVTGSPDYDENIVLCSIHSKYQTVNELADDIKKLSQYMRNSRNVVIGGDFNLKHGTNDMKRITAIFKQHGFSRYTHVDTLYNKINSSVCGKTTPKYELMQIFYKLKDYELVDQNDCVTKVFKTSSHNPILLELNLIDHLGNISLIESLYQTINDSSSLDEVTSLLEKIKIVSDRISDKKNMSNVLLQHIRSMNEMKKKLNEKKNVLSKLKSSSIPDIPQVPLSPIIPQTPPLSPSNPQTPIASIAQMPPVHGPLSPLSPGIPQTPVYVSPVSPVPVSPSDRNQRSQGNQIGGILQNYLENKKNYTSLKICKI